MDTRIELKVLGISYNELHSGAFALLLAQVDGPYRIPIVIGAAEAQSIAIALEGVKPPRPMTHDLFASFAQAFGVRLESVFIYKFENGIFYSELSFTDGERQIILDGRTSDAIAIAMRSRSPIYATREILDETGFIIEEETSTLRKPEPCEIVEEPSENKPESLSVEELETLLEKLIEEERYEEAANINSILKSKKE